MRSGPPAAVLVGLDLDQCGFGPPGQSRDRPGVRVGLLEVVDGALHQELPQLGDGRVPGNEGREARTGVPTGQREQRCGDRFGGPDRLDISRNRSAQRILEGDLDPGPRPQQLGGPLPAFVHPVQTAIVQLVQAQQGQLEIVVRQDVDTALHRVRHG